MLVVLFALRWYYLYMEKHTSYLDFHTLASTGGANLTSLSGNSSKTRIRVLTTRQPLPPREAKSGEENDTRKHEDRKESSDDEDEKPTLKLPPIRPFRSNVFGGVGSSSPPSKLSGSRLPTLEEQRALLAAHDAGGSPIGASRQQELSNPLLGPLFGNKAQRPQL